MYRASTAHSMGHYLLYDCSSERSGIILRETLQARYLVKENRIKQNQPPFPSANRLQKGHYLHMVARSIISSLHGQQTTHISFYVRSRFCNVSSASVLCYNLLHRSTHSSGSQTRFKNSTKALTHEIPQKLQFQYSLMKTKPLKKLNKKEASMVVSG